MEKTDFLIIGAGIIGMSLALEIKRKYPSKSITIIEKEDSPGLHGSGRNSGVLHAGFYYTENTLKAKFTREGNREITRYCGLKGLKINRCGKVVVTRNESELQSLYELEKRGRKNGVELQIIDEHELKSLEPNAKTLKKALYSPTTSTVDPLEICSAFMKDLLALGVRFDFNRAYKKRSAANAIITSKGHIEAGRIINAAGLYADKIAKDFSFGHEYAIIPFKGIYLKNHGHDKTVSMNLYPVPNLKNPFLGVHFTVTVDGHIKIGPTAIPAFWRENYGSLQNFRFNELIEVLFQESRLFINNSFNFRSLAVDEMKKYRRKHFLNLAMGLVNELDTFYFDEWSRPGIRAQLLDLKKCELVNDFIIQGDSESLHVLNAVSPAFTSSLPFCRWIIESYI